MSRKRFVTSDISTDAELAKVTSENEQAAFMWPWFLLAFDDWGRAEVNPIELKLSIFPAFSISYDDIDAAVRLYDKHGLIHLYSVDDDLYAAINPKTWLKYQTYLSGTKRSQIGSKIPEPITPPWGKNGEAAAFSGMVRKRSMSADKTECQLTSEEGSCQTVLAVPSPSLSPSPSNTKEKDTPLPPTGGETPLVVSSGATDDGKTPKKSKPARPRRGAGIEYSQEFERFWQAYPRHIAKDAAFQAWEKTIGGKHGPPPREPTALIDAAARYAQDCRSKCTEDQYILHASTFLGPKRRWKDFTRPPDWNAPVIGATSQVASLRDVQGFSPQMTPEGGEIDAKERLRRAQRAEGRC